MMKDQATLQFTKQPYEEDVGSRRIESIRFPTFSGAEILKVAEVQVSSGHYYGDTRQPIENGLLDSRMGPLRKDGHCKSCGGHFKQCPGHCGYLSLALPVYNVGYLGTIVDILKCICKNCSRVLLKEKERQSFLKKMRNPKMEPLKKCSEEV